MRPTTTIPLAIMLGLAAAGCQQIQQNQGYIIDESLVASVQPGVDNKSSVQKVLGRPTFAGEFNANDWYYVSRNTRQLAFLQPKAKTQSIIKVSFDAKGNVARVERRGLEQVVAVNPVDEKTPTLGRRGGLFEDIFGGVGALGSGTQTNDSAGGTQSGRDGPR